MCKTYYDRRKSGISLIGNVSWGTSLCQFYKTKQDLLDIMVPYLKTGLKNHELCVWVTSEPLDPAAVKEALQNTIPDLKKYTQTGQLEIIPGTRWNLRGRKSGKSILSRLDKAISSGFDGLRLAFVSPPESQGNRIIPFAGENRAIARNNVIALFAYSRNDFDAIGLMDIVRNHQSTLIHNADRWEVIESSETRVVKNALDRSEEKLRSLFAHMAEGFAYHRIILDSHRKPVDYVFLEVNSAFEKIVGLKAKDIIGKRVTRVLPGIENDPADWIGKYGKVALTGKPFRLEEYSRTLNKWYSVSAFSPHKGFFAVTFNDITERKQYENELLRVKTEWERTFDSVPDLIAILDDQHRIVRVNRAMAEKFGLAPDQCTGLHCYQIVHGLMEPPGFCPHSQTCRDGKEHLSEVYDPALGGTFLVSTTPIFDNQGKFIGSTHVARDITERKLAEEALRQRTLELEASNKELEAFSYTVSHDLRAPLRSMDGYSQALLEEYAGQLDQQGREWLKRIRASSQMMAQLIDDILGLSRVVRAELQIQTVNLSEIAGSVIKELQAACPERQVEFVITPGIKTQGDLNLLRILMSNLLGNAFKFTSRCSGARIEFGAAEIDNRLYYFVRDNGAGFDMKYADKLFKPFQRLHSVEEFPGTGIGLATVQRIILRHGGEIKAESRPGRGATFYFSLNGI